MTSTGKDPAGAGSDAAGTLGYRPCVGAALFNRNGRVWVGRRVAGPNDPEGDDVWWQMPQGGIDPGEDVHAAALRELWEETNVRTVSLLAEAPEWLTYDLPAHLIGRAWKGRWRGQKQKWFAFRFDGEESEIDVRHPGDGKHKPEFGHWRWEKLDRLPDLVVPFKRQVYEQLVAIFRPLISVG